VLLAQLAETFGNLGVGARTLAEVAQRRLRSLGIDNVTVVVGDGTLGAPDYAPFDRIIVTAAAPEIPQKLIEQLREGGIMVVPVGPVTGVQSLLRVRKKPKGEGLERETLMQVRFVPLVAGKASAL